MGTYSFYVPNDQNLADYSVQTSHVIGFDGVPCQSESVLRDQLLQIEREEFDSGRVLVPWRIPSQSTYGLATATLIERAQPYVLSVELCRGLLNRIRNQLATWTMNGFQPSAASSKLLSQSTDQWIESMISSDADRVAHHAGNSISTATTLMHKLTQEYASYFESKDLRNSTFWQGLQYDVDVTAADFPQISVALVPMHWDEMETNQDQFEWERYDELLSWCKKQRLCVMGGPFFDLHHDRVPDWLYLWEDRSESIESFLRRFVSNAVSRLMDKVQLWQCHAATNAQSKLGLNEEEQLRLTVAVIESIRQVDKKTPLLITIQQPCGEYLVKNAVDLSPIQLADMIGRAGIGVSGFNLRFEFGTALHQSLFRDVFQIGELLDTWSLLGKPIVVQLSVTDMQSVGIKTADMVDVIRMIATKPSVQGIVFEKTLTDVMQLAK